MKYNDNWNTYQKALYHDQQGDWNSAHDLVDGLAGQKTAHIHAYLHRKEGDEWNARYWYNRANQAFFEGSLEEEWQELWALYG